MNARRKIFSFCFRLVCVSFLISCLALTISQRTFWPFSIVFIFHVDIELINWQQQVVSEQQWWSWWWEKVVQSIRNLLIFFAFCHSIPSITWCKHSFHIYALVVNLFKIKKVMNKKLFFFKSFFSSTKRVWNRIKHE